MRGSAGRSPANRHGKSHAAPTVHPCACEALDGCVGADGFAEVAALREELFRRNVINRAAGNPREAYQRIRRNLQTSRSIVEEGGPAGRAH